LLTGLPKSSNRRAGRNRLEEIINQHFIPRLLLRGFGDASGRRIDLIHLDSGKRIDGASIRHQAALDNFYGLHGDKDEVLTLHENAVAPIIGRLLNGKSPEDLSIEERQLLVLFVLSMRGRTPSAAENEDELVDQVSRKIAQNVPGLHKMAEFVRSRWDDSVAVSLGITATCFPIAMDLGIQVLQNSSSIPLVLSDNPVVFQNPLLEPTHTLGSITGIGARGLLILLPLSARACLLLYDKGVYRVRRSRDSCARIGADDTRIINLLEASSASEVIYIPSWTDEAEVRALVKGAKFYRCEQAIVIDEKLESNGGVTLRCHHNEICIGKRLSVLKDATPQGIATYSEGQISLRNPPLCHAIALFSELVERGIYKGNEFSLYLSDIASNGLGLPDRLLTGRTIRAGSLLFVRPYRPRNLPQL
jgi:hypothetical protein